MLKIAPTTQAVSEQQPADGAPPAGKSQLLMEQIKPRKLKRALLCTLGERRAEPLDYVGVSFGVTDQVSPVALHILCALEGAKKTMR